ncbi:MAG: hypothetical protein ABSA93_06500 [Streptosporangiaceae bacterium]|jgi:hypothetical protein
MRTTNLDETLRGGTLVVDQPGGTDSLSLRPCRAIDRFTARMLGTRLDRELAAGRAPEWSRLHAARAEHIVSLPFRQALADDWERLTQPRTRKARLPQWHRVATAERQIRLLAGRLRAPLPVPARGVALAGLLLTDGGGPLYNPLSTVALDDVVNRAAALLDPAAPLLPN